MIAWTSVLSVALLATPAASDKNEPTSAAPAESEVPRTDIFGPPTALPGLRQLPPREENRPEFDRSEPIRPSEARAIPDTIGDAPPARVDVETPTVSDADRAKQQAETVVAESLKIPKTKGIQGQPMPLAQAMAASTDRKLQLVILHGYWQLTEAVAKYRFAFDQSKQFEQMQSAPADAAALLAAQSGAAATLREAEAAVLAAQNDLAAHLRLAADAALPLPSDQPLVGAYLTNYQSLFASRLPPPIVRVIDRTLPIRLSAINDRTIAVQAARDAALAAWDAYQAGRADFHAVLASHEFHLRQRRAMIETVCRYNHDIGEYAVAVLDPNLPAQQLVLALIETKSTEKQGDVRPVEFVQPTNISPRQNPTGQAAPALHPMRDQPTLAPIETRPTPPSEEPNAFRPEDSLRHITNKVVVEENSSALYPALIDAAPAVQAKQLALALHWDRNLPENSVRPLSLADCLARDSGTRRETLVAYWLARQRAAEYQAVAQEIDFLVGLASDAELPADSFDALSLKAHQADAQAALGESHAALIESQFELALRTRCLAEKNWPLPSTTPHAGGFALNLASQPVEIAQSRPILRLAATIPTLAASVEEHATAVVAADTARSTALDSYHADKTNITTVLHTITNETRQSFAFLKTLTEYNVSTTDYILAVMPPSATTEQLTATLTTER
jgi:hypothetical protein